jgi:hypothetical protein
MTSTAAFPSLGRFMSFAQFKSEMAEESVDTDWAVEHCELALAAAVEQAASLDVLREYLRELRHCTRTPQSEHLVFKKDFVIAMVPIIEELYDGKRGGKKAAASTIRSPVGCVSILVPCQSVNVFCCVS